MARSFSKPHRLHVMNELNVTPMLDLCFCLLIIFMIATPVLEQTTAVNLPKAEKGAGKSPDTKAPYRFGVIGAAGSYSLGNRPVTPAQLGEEFASIAALPEADQPVVRVRGDGALQYL
ncbi:MAG: ExbD/TolR family protein [Verrucomicrobiota bacterium]